MDICGWTGTGTGPVTTGPGARATGLPSDPATPTFARATCTTTTAGSISGLTGTDRRGIVTTIGVVAVVIRRPWHRPFVARRRRLATWLLPRAGEVPAWPRNRPIRRPLLARVSDHPRLWRPHRPLRRRDPRFVPASRHQGIAAADSPNRGVPWRRHRPPSRGHLLVDSRRSLAPCPRPARLVVASFSPDVRRLLRPRLSSAHREVASSRVRRWAPVRVFNPGPCPHREAPRPVVASRPSHARPRLPWELGPGLRRHQLVPCPRRRWARPVVSGPSRVPAPLLAWEPEWHVHPATLLPPQAGPPPPPFKVAVV